ncbi:hypothetical protein Pmani_029355 [Petrolisthes manimaculis]|uniref:DUF7869 domain-containing protein n=1 Tax=Petrolisthes manimaculis TaxID=1843537 RepID=A0AAE1NY69_9EUCA|nr:hypothetical protein Pmani_029355 [Petrolisthes manimaculis]
MAMHAIGTTRLTTALRKVTSIGMVISDQRGRHEPANKIVGAKAFHVREHIKLLPAMSCHSSRVNAPHRKYLEYRFTTEKLFVSYMEWLRDTYPEEKASLHYYSDVFTKEFNISFEQPRTDTCTTCNTFDVSIKNSNGDQAAVDDLIRQKKEHQQLAQQAQDFMKKIGEDNDPETRAICVDLQQTLPTPKITACVAYYKRKMWTYNLCIHNLKTNTSIMYLWDETQAKRGSCEVASCIKHWIDEESNIADFSQLVVVSDNCAGQNKNINLVLFYLRELHSRRLMSIDHVYLVPGHSYMACDRALGNIERHLRRVPILYTPEDYAYHIEQSVSRRYKVMRMKQAMFLNIGVL